MLPQGLWKKTNGKKRDEKTPKVGGEKLSDADLVDAHSGVERQEILEAAKSPKSVTES